MESLFEGKIKVLNNLPYHLVNGASTTSVKEEDIIKYICNDDGVFYMKYFMGQTYLNVNNNQGLFPMLHVLIAIHEVFEIIADLEIRDAKEEKYNRDFFPFIVQLAKIGARKADGQPTPLHMMEQMILGEK